MSAAVEELVLGAVQVGDHLPPLTHDVSATTVVLGAMASRDFRPMHHDKDFAVNRNGTKDIFLNTPNLAAWFERYLTDWTGPKGRPGRMKFRIRDSIFPGDRMTFSGVVSEVSTDATGCGWVALDVKLTVEDRVCCECAVRVAVPTSSDDNPWQRKGDRWQP